MATRAENAPGGVPSPPKEGLLARTMREDAARYAAMSSRDRLRIEHLRAYEEAKKVVTQQMQMSAMQQILSQNAMQQQLANQQVFPGQFIVSKDAWFLIADDMKPLPGVENDVSMTGMKLRHGVDAGKTHEIFKSYECSFCPLCGEKIEQTQG